MNYLIFSDVHSFSNTELEKLLKRYKNYEVYALGDYGSSLELLKKYKVNYVCGNTDFLNKPKYIIKDIAGTKTYITHGHLYNVKHSLLSLYYTAKEAGCSQVFFGHTHSFLDIMYEDVHFLNPGALLNYSYVTIENGVVKRRSVLIDWY